MIGRDTWFEGLFGFTEESPDQVRSVLSMTGTTLTSSVNGAVFECGSLEIPTLETLRRRTADCALASEAGGLEISEIVGDIQEIHKDPGVAGATFQVASQFNLLEMVGPGVPPEHGVGIYEFDGTQGPACAIACGAATVYRNYFVPMDGQIGQSESCQIDCLDELGRALENEGCEIWQMKNGYALPGHESLEQISDLLEQMPEAEVDALRSKLKIGVQSKAEVTVSDARHQVTQTFCSATPVAYSQQSSSLWEPLARLVLDASYEAAFRAAILNAEKTGNRDFYLTLLGGGAFGNPAEWITDAILRSLDLFSDFPLNVKLVSYGSSNPDARNVVEAFGNSE